MTTDMGQRVALDVRSFGVLMTHLGSGKVILVVFTPG
jgi:hypothetical protein